MKVENIGEYLNDVSIGHSSINKVIDIIGIDLMDCDNAICDNSNYQEYKCLSKSKVHNHKSKKNKIKRRKYYGYYLYA